MKKNNVLKVAFVGLSVFALASCGSGKEISREDASKEYSSIETTGATAPTKFTFTSKSSGAFVTPSAEEADVLGEIMPFATTGSLDLTYTYSKGEYFYVKLNNLEYSVYYKDSQCVLNLNGLKATLNIDFNAAFEQIQNAVKSFKLGVEDIINTYGPKVLDGFFSGLASIEGVTEKYTTTGAGNLTANVTYTKTNSYSTSFAIDSYLLKSLVYKVNDSEIVNYTLNTDNVKFEGPTA